MGDLSKINAAAAACYQSLRQGRPAAAEFADCGGGRVYSVLVSAVTVAEREEHESMRGSREPKEPKEPSGR